MDTLRKNVYTFGPGTKWEDFTDVLVRYALNKYGLTITKDFASKFNSIDEFDDYILKNGGDF